MEGMDTPRILVIGGHGKIALLLAPLLTARGDLVDAVIRNPEHADDVTASGANPVVADIVRKFNVEVSVLYGNIDYIQDEPFGYLIVVIMGDMETQAKAFSYIKTLPIGSEVLGYVPRNH